MSAQPPRSRTPQQPYLSALLHRHARTLLGCYLLLVVAIVFAPQPTIPTDSVLGISSLLTWLGLPGWLASGNLVEFVTNVALFVPLALLGSLLRPSWTVARWVLVGLACTCVIEGAQWLFLPDRSAQLRDIVSNTTGALLGALAAKVVRSRASRVLMPAVEGGQLCRNP